MVLQISTEHELNTSLQDGGCGQRSVCSVTSHIESMLSMVQAKLQKPSVPQNNVLDMGCQQLASPVFTGVGTEELFKY